MALVNERQRKCAVEILREKRRLPQSKNARSRRQSDVCPSGRLGFIWTRALRRQRLRRPRRAGNGKRNCSARSLGLCDTLGIEDRLAGLGRGTIGLGFVSANSCLLPSSSTAPTASGAVDDDSSVDDDGSGRVSALELCRAVNSAAVRSRTSPARADGAASCLRTRLNNIE